MAQYKTGKATVTKGSAIVTGVDTLWLTNVNSGDAFTIAGTSVMYDVASVTSDAQLNLSAPYAGGSTTGATYAITRDFTSPDNFPELTAGDIETPTILTRAIRKIQQRFNSPVEISALSAANIYKGVAAGLTGTVDGDFFFVIENGDYSLYSNASNSAVLEYDFASGFSGGNTTGSISASDTLLENSTLDLDFSENTYKVYEGLSGGLTAKLFSEVITFTRPQPASGHNALGVVSNVAVDEKRLVGNKEGLLLEALRQNILLWSEDYTNAAYTKVGTTVDPTETGGPSGKLVEDTSTGVHSLSQSAAVETGKTYVYATLIKASGRAKLSVAQGGAYTANAYQFDLAAGVVDQQGDARNYIKSVGEGWWLCVAITEAASTGNGTHTVSLRDDAGNLSYTGDGTSGINVWAQQVEVGSTPSSYIKTEGTAVTRDADSVVRTLAGEFNSNQGTLFININLASFTALGATNSRIIEVSDGTASGRITIGTTPSGAVVADILFAGNTYSASVANTSKSLKVALAYTQTSVALSVGGVTSTTATAFRSLNFSELRVGSSVASGGVLATVGRVSHIPFALAEADLNILTAA